METTITREDLLSLGPIPENLHASFLRVANGLVTRAGYPKEKVMGLLAQMLRNPKKFAYSKNKVTNLAQAIYELNKQGVAVPLSGNRCGISAGRASGLCAAGRRKAGRIQL